MIRSVNFGRSKAGLATVGYRLRASDGTYSAWVTAGVVEDTIVGVGTGIYWADVDESASPASIVWDTGEMPPRVAVADLRVSLGGEQAGQLSSVESRSRLIDADVTIDKSVSPWQMVWTDKDTGTELLRKDLFDRNDDPIESVNQRIGSLLSP